MNIRLKQTGQELAFARMQEGVYIPTGIDIYEHRNPLTGEIEANLDYDDSVETLVQTIVENNPEMSMKQIWPMVNAILSQKEARAVTEAFRSMTYQDMAVMKWEEKDLPEEKREYDPLRPEEEFSCIEFCEELDDDLAQQLIRKNGPQLWALKKAVLRTLCMKEKDGFTAKIQDPMSLYNSMLTGETATYSEEAKQHISWIAQEALGTDLNRKVWHEKAANEFLKRRLLAPSYRISSLPGVQFRFGSNGTISYGGSQHSYSKSADIVTVDEMPDGRIHAYIFSHKYCRQDGGSQGSQKKDLESFITNAMAVMSKPGNADIPVLREALAKELGREISPEQFSWTPGALADGGYFEGKYQDIRGKNQDERIFVGSSDDFQHTFQTRERDVFRSWLERRKPKSTVKSKASSESMISLAEAAKTV